MLDVTSTQLNSTQLSHLSPAGVATALTAIASLSRDESVRDDDQVARLNHWGAYALLMMLALAAGAKQYVGDPVNCWVPAQFDEKWYNHYVNNYCWVHPLYKVPFSEPMPVEDAERWVTLTGFYRWVVVCFIFQALLFRLPRGIWHMAKWQSGINVEKIVSMTMDTALADPKTRDEKLGHVAEFMHRWASTRKRPSHTGRAFQMRNYMDSMWKRSGYFLVGLYLFVKGLYLAVSILQFQVISMFLDVNFWVFGPQVLSDTIFSSTPRISGRWLSEDAFPRMAICDFRLRQLSNVQVHSVQCVLPINIFLEKMYLVLWFFITMLAIINLYSFMSWGMDLLSARKTRHFLDKFAHVITPGKTPKNSEIRMFNSLARGYLKSDGIFLVKIIAANATDLLAADLLRQIWVRYKKYRNKQGRVPFLPEDGVDTPRDEYPMPPTLSS
ncbi:hypothetical protein EGW08_021030 [Elysia chlorotica]|uniref:Innexin n=1 Tax=Elysia chlorotica TaxID=188477 RepID=A0A3S1AXY1_ELYCH|nr:hypothetical protein EGW08_021030 [Elysia chlorotica]